MTSHPIHFSKWWRSSCPPNLMRQRNISPPLPPFSPSPSDRRGILKPQNYCDSEPIQSQRHGIRDTLDLALQGLNANPNLRKGSLSLSSNGSLASGGSSDTLNRKTVRFADSNGGLRRKHQRPISFSGHHQTPYNTNSNPRHSVSPMDKMAGREDLISSVTQLIPTAAATTKPPRPPKLQPRRQTVDVIEVKDSYLKLHQNRQRLVAKGDGNLYSLPATNVPPAAPMENTYVNTMELFGDLSSPDIVFSNRIFEDSGFDSASSGKTGQSTPPRSRFDRTSPTIIECINSARLDTFSQPFMAPANGGSSAPTVNGKKPPTNEMQPLQRSNISVWTEFVSGQKNEMTSSKPQLNNNDLSEPQQFKYTIKPFPLSPAELESFASKDLIPRESLHRLELRDVHSEASISSSPKLLQRSSSLKTYGNRAEDFLQSQTLQNNYEGSTSKEENQLFISPNRGRLPPKSQLDSLSTETLTPDSSMELDSLSTHTYVPINLAALPYILENNNNNNNNTSFASSQHKKMENSLKQSSARGQHTPSSQKMLDVSQWHQQSSPSNTGLQSVQPNANSLPPLASKYENLSMKMCLPNDSSERGRLSQTTTETPSTPKLLQRHGSLKKSHAIQQDVLQSDQPPLHFINIINSDRSPPQMDHTLRPNFTVNNIPTLLPTSNASATSSRQLTHPLTNLSPDRTGFISPGGTLNRDGIWRPVPHSQLAGTSPPTLQFSQQQQHLHHHQQQQQQQQHHHHQQQHKQQFRPQTQPSRLQQSSHPQAGPVDDSMENFLMHELRVQSPQTASMQAVPVYFFNQQTMPQTGTPHRILPISISNLSADEARLIDSLAQIETRLQGTSRRL